MDDRQIVDLYWERSEAAISETEKKYKKYCLYISSHILKNTYDAEEIVNDAFLTTWNSIPPRRPESLKSFVGLITRRLSFNRFEKDRAKKRSVEMTIAIEELSECLSDWQSELLVDELALRETINRFVRSLSPLSQQVFVRRYWYAATIDEIAKACKITESHVSVLLFRLRKQLKKQLIKEEITS